MSDNSTSTPSSPARSSNQAWRSVHLEPATADVLLDKLVRFLKALPASELADIPIIAAERALHPPGGARPDTFRQPELPEPVEVTFPRVGGEIVGALLIRGKWMEQAITQNCNSEIQQSPAWTERLAEICEEWRGWLAGSISRMLVRQAEILPYALDTALFEYWDEASFEQILDLLEDSTAEQIERWLEVPAVLGIVQYFASQRKGEGQERGRAILKKWTAAKRGRRNAGQDHKDIRIAKQVAKIERDLKDAFEYPRKNRTHQDSRLIRDELNARGYTSDEADRIVRHPRSLQAAAAAVFALRFGQPEESVSVRASRGRRLLKSRRRP